MAGVFVPIYSQLLFTSEAEVDVPRKIPTRLRNTQLNADYISSLFTVVTSLQRGKIYKEAIKMNETSGYGLERYQSETRKCRCSVKPVKSTKTTEILNLFIKQRASNPVEFQSNLLCPLSHG